ncbi:MAG: YDG domain-containing protein [Gallionella sp.]|nr:YDG domain-containing protein [Gallionella sp.]
MTTSSSLVSTLWRRSALTVALAGVFAAGQAQANGTDPSVVEGQASFSTLGSSLSVTNSPGAIINWQGFSIGASETTRFIQQSAASSVLNRVIGPDPSVILGTLTSNGRVFLINPSGILVGQGAHIDVAGLVASTLNLSNQDFLAGRLNFASNPSAGSVENQGSITTPTGGSVYLVGANVTNSGIINSPQGDVILAAGQSVSIFDTSTPGVRVEITASDNTAVNLGEILAQSGQVGIYGAALRNAGIINADQVVRDASGKIVLRAKQDVTLEAGSRLSANGEQGGAITVQSESGTTLVSGTIDAKGTGAVAGNGGTIKLLGDRVGLIAASIDASGTTGGGTVLIGGDYQGKNPSVQNASATYVSPDASVKADAITSGNGGKVIVWADDFTRFGGNISARGGAYSGDGGFVEVSGKHYLDFLGIVNTLAPAGKAGTLLLDPSDITISAGVNAGMTAPGTTSPFTGALATSTLNVTTLTNALGGGNVLVDASAGAAAGAGNITVSTVITWVAATTLELRAKNDLLVSAAMTDNTAGAGIKLTAGHDVTVNGAISANGAPAAITLSAGHDVLVNAALSANGAGSVVELRADNLGTGIGTVTFSGAGSVSGPTPTTNIYYNPTSYANYAADRAVYLSFVPSGLNTYMLLFVTGLSADKTYNGNTTAVLTGIATIAPAIGDTVNLAGTGSVTNFSNKDVHTEVLTLSGYSINGANASKYSLFQPASLSASITAKALTQSGLSVAASRIYDATTDTTLIGASALLAAEAPGAGTAADGKAYTGDDVSLTGTSTGTYNSKDVATASTVTFSGLSLAGAQLGNYSLTALATQAALITARDITAVTGITAADKTYSGDTTAVLTTSGAGFTGIVGGELLTVGAATGTFNDKDVLDATTVNITGITLANGVDPLHLASNYNLTSTTASDAAIITVRDITAVTGITAADKTYSGDTTAVLTTSGAGFTGIVGGEVLTVGAATGTFNDKDVLEATTVNITGNTLANGVDPLHLASNYNLTSTTASDAAIITARALTIGGTVTNNKVYNGDTLATLSNIGSVATGIAGEALVLNGPLAANINFNDLNVLLANTVTGTGYSIANGVGGLASNYALTSTTSTAAANITTKGVTIGGTVANNKVYNGDTLATLGNIGSVATGIAGEALVLNGPLAANINFNTKDVATANLVTGTGYSIANGVGGLASNYALTSTTSTAAADITPANLAITADALGKVYGTADPSLTYTTGAFQFGDTAATVLSGTLNRAVGETVAGGPYAINQGALVSPNYTISYTGANLSITPAPLNVVANPQSKLFGTSDPALTFSVTGLVNNPALGIADTAGSVLSGALTRIPGESALGGPYTINQGNIVANSNYILSYTRNNLIITGVAAEPSLGFNPGQVIFTGIINNDYYQRPGNFWHISLNYNNADPGFDVMRGTNDLNSRLNRSLNSCDSVSGGGACETWSFPQQREKVDKKKGEEK